MTAYYNEHDAEKAAWIRELIRRNMVAPGDVDERSITDVRADDLRGYTQCHFFAGIAVWSYALRLAGWPDDRAAWTGSCPCPSFSAAGKGEGFDDARHLWPAWWPLIRERRPATVFGEQVAAAIRHGWWDLVSTDLESETYATASAVLTSAGVGGPDIRERLYWVADSDQRRSEQCDAGEWSVQLISAECKANGLADAEHTGRHGTPGIAAVAHRNQPQDGLLVGDGATSFEPFAADALKGYWGTADWLYCTDGRWRPVEAGTFPLADGAAFRLGRLRGYGDAINAQVAQAFIKAYIETRKEL